MKKTQTRTDFWYFAWKYTFGVLIGGAHGHLHMSEAFFWDQLASNNVSVVHRR